MTYGSQGGRGTKEKGNSQKSEGRKKNPRKKKLLEFIVHRG